MADRDIVAYLKGLASATASPPPDPAPPSDKPQADELTRPNREAAKGREAALTPGSLFPDLEATGQAGSPSGAGPTTTAPTGRPSPPGDPAADDQPGPLAEAAGQAQREGDPAHAEADRPAATTPAAPAPRRPGGGEATDTEAPTPDAPADPSGAGQADGQASGQTTGQASGQAASGGELDAQGLWLRAVDELAGELPPAVVEGLRDATARWGGTKPPGPRSYDLRCRCGSAAWNLTVLLRPPHYGHAVRCVCGRCRKVLGLLWWADGPGRLADDPPHRGELAADS
jgi:hypothetical protein